MDLIDRDYLWLCYNITNRANFTGIKVLLLDSNNNDVVKSLITETMYFIEWIAPDIEFDYAFELANLGRFLTRWLFSLEVWNNIEARNQIINELGTWNDRVLQMSQLLTL